MMSKKINWKNFNPNFINFNSKKNVIQDHSKNDPDRFEFMGRKLTIGQFRNFFNSDMELMKFMFNQKLRRGDFRFQDDIDSWYMNTIQKYGINPSGLLNLFRKLWLANRILKG